jgi:colanic acid/amylovoran biosynthesis glycosyltransferase
MKIAIITNKFPGHSYTFFQRDIIALIKSYNKSIDIFTIYPISKKFWELIKPINNINIDPKNVKHFSVNKLNLFKISKKQYKVFLVEYLLLLKSSYKYGLMATLKTTYTAFQALIWISNNCNYDKLIAYWGNYSATLAYLMNKLSFGKVKYSMFLHAGLDLYFQPIFLEKKLICASEIIVVCEYNKEYIKKNYYNLFSKIESKIFIHHLGLDMENFNFDFNKNKNGNILAIGRFDKCKGFDILIKSFSKLSKTNETIKLTIIGDGKEKQKLNKLIKNEKISKRVFMTGFLSFDKIKQYLINSAIFVHPSSEIGDAVPTVIKEALASGIPVIASNIVGIPELLDYGNCGILVQPANVNTLAEEMDKLLKNRKKRFLLSKRGRKFAENKFNMWRNGNRLLKIIEGKNVWN